LLLRLFVFAGQKEGVQGLSGIGTQKRFSDTLLAFIPVSTAIRAKSLRARLAFDFSPAGLTVHRLKSISNGAVVGRSRAV
jgi:hypothetical protein